MFSKFQSGFESWSFSGNQLGIHIDVLPRKSGAVGNDISTHRPQGKCEISRYHLPMVFSTLAFSVMNSHRLLHSCSVSAGFFLSRLIWQNGNRSEGSAALEN